MKIKIEQDSGLHKKSLGVSLIKPEFPKLSCLLLRNQPKLLQPIRFRERKRENE